ncbi:MAG: hypothetical protein QME94_19995, partial [Anaerolineae bacterium]|nr:hypothetical protein [Anaerolineae bacterium]
RCPHPNPSPRRALRTRLGEGLGLGQRRELTGVPTRVVSLNTELPRGDLHRRRAEPALSLATCAAWEGAL